MSKTYIHEISPDNGATVLTLKDAEAAPISLLEDTVGWVSSNLASDMDASGLGKGKVTVTKDTGTVLVYNEESYANSGARIKLYGIPKNKDCKLTFTATEGSGGTAKIGTFAAYWIQGGYIVSSTISKTVTQTGDFYEISFNSGNNPYEYIGIDLYCTGDTASVGSVTYSEIIVRDADAPYKGYSQMHKSVEEELADKASISLLKDTVGWVGKNLFDDNKAEAGVAWNGSSNSARGRLVVPCKPSTSYIVTMHGTNNLDQMGYALSASLPASSGYNGISSFPTTITTGANDNYISFGFNKTSITKSDITALKLMVRDAAITDSTYEPYHPSVEQCKFDRAEQRVLGAKNLCPITVATQVISGITFTVNSDGSISANGTASADAVLWLSTVFQNGLPKDTDLTLSGCPSGGSNSTYFLSTRIGLLPNDSYVRNDLDVGSGVNLRITSSNTIKVSITVKSGQTVNNLVFKPMLRLASDPDDTYVPYAMTNRELTEQFPTAYSTSGLTYTNCTYVAGGYYKIGKVCFFNIRIKTKSDLATSDDVYIAGLPTYSGISNTVVVTGFGYSSLSEVTINKPVVLYTNGNLKLSHSLTANSDYLVNGFYLCD